VLIVERQQRVLEILQQRKTVDLDKLAEEVGVSVSTVRRDLETLEEQGLVERTHGGAVYRGPKRQSIVFFERLNEQVEAKEAIGRRAAALIEPYMTVFLDGGSTVLYAAQQIEARPIQVVTNSLGIAHLFADEDDVELMVAGGYLYPRSGVLVGPIGRRSFEQLHADLLLFSAAAIDDEACYNHNVAMAEIEQAMMAQTARSVLLMDASKFGRKSLARVCGVDDVEQIISDPDVSPRWHKQFGDRLVVAR